MNEYDALYKIAQIIGEYITKIETERDYYKAMNDMLKEADNDREGIQSPSSGE